MKRILCLLGLHSRAHSWAYQRVQVGIREYEFRWVARCVRCGRERFPVDWWGTG
jgi:hypothetical protein